MLAALLEQGFRYAMISNADNLGSRLEPRIERSDGIEPSRSLDCLEWDRRPPLTGMLLTRATHLAALFQEHPDAGGEVRG